MKITIEIEDDNGVLVQRSSNNSIEMSVQELYRFERHNKEEII